MQPRPGGEGETPDRAEIDRPGLGSRRVVWGAFGASAVIHVLAVILYPYLFDRLDPEGAVFAPPAVAGSTQGSEVIRLIEIDATPDPEQPDEPDEIEDLDEPAPEADAPTFDLPGIEVAPPGPTAADRLRPRLLDARIWRTPPDEFFELTLEQREELLLADRIAEWYDSLQAAQAAEAALTDWTFTDADGGRWGISPGKIHLGDVTLPLPVNFGVPVGKRDETNLLVWQWEEIMRQKARAEMEMTFQERAAAIRARRDRERAAQLPDTTRFR